MIEDTAKFLGIPSIIFHSEFGLPTSSFKNKPPLTPPAKTLLLELSLGSNIAALVLPPTLLGPLWIHAISSFSPGTPSILIPLMSFNSFWISKRFSVLGLPRTGSIVSSQSLSL